MSDPVQCFVSRVSCDEPRYEKIGLWDFRPVCIATEDGWRFEVKVEEGLYYPYGENKDADQPRSYCAADLRICFRICKNPVFS